MHPDPDASRRDAGQYVGHEPELAAETIPGGVQPDDVRVAAVGSRPPMRPGRQPSDPVNPPVPGAGSDANTGMGGRET